MRTQLIFNRSLYGLKQAPKAWYNRFASYILQLGFVEAKTDTLLFVYHQGGDTMYLLHYVDDIILTASSTLLLRHVISALKDLSELHQFLGMHVQRSGTALLFW